MGKSDKIVKQQKIAEKKAKKVVESSSDSSDSESEVQVVAKKSKVQAKASKKVAKKVESSSDSDSDDTPVVKKPVAKKVVAKKAESSDSSDSESEVKPVKKAAKKVVAKKAESSDDSSSEEEVKPVKKAAKKVVAKKAESSDDSSSEEEKPAKKAAPAKKASKQVESSDDSSSEEEKPVKKTSKKSSKQVQSDDSSSEEEDKIEEEKPKKAAVAETPAAKSEQLEQNQGRWEAVIRGLSYDADENDIGNWFEENAGSVESVKLLKDRESGRSRGMAFVVFEEMETLAKAMTKSGSQHMGRTVYIDNAANKGERQGGRPQQGGQQSQLPEGAVTCFIGNLPYKCTEQDLKNFFGSCGGIVGARIAKEQDNPERSRGFGHIDFENADASNAAIAMNGQEFQGRPIKVDQAAARQGGGSRGGARGGRGGSRGGSVQLSRNDQAAKKGAIVAFQGARKTL